MGRRSVATVCVLILTLGITGCRTEDNSIPAVEEQDRIISQAFRTDDPSIIRVTWFPVECETFDRVETELDEQFAKVTIRVTVDVATCPPGGFNETLVDFGEPIGDRRIFDTAFGDSGDTVLLEDPTG